MLITGNGIAGKRIVIFGAGVTGLAAAYELSRHNPTSITIIERSPEIGGLAGTVRRNGLKLDLGSHRIHPNYEPYALELLQNLLGDQLIERPRLGRIRINGRFLGYPPTPLEILTAFGVSYTARFSLDYFLQTIVRWFSGDDRSSFEKFLIRRVGKSLYDSFYRPYALKLWNLDPSGIDYAAGLNRAKKFELSALLRGVWAIITRKKLVKKYFYPAGGIGQIAVRFADEIRGKAEILLDTSIQEIEIGTDRRIQSVRVREKDGIDRKIEADIVVSTISVQALHSLVNIPGDDKKPDYELRMRSLRILYLAIEDQISGDSETVYIPDPAFRIGRVSQISRYSPNLNPSAGGTVLALEMICTEGDDTWTMSDENLAEIALEELRRLHIVRPDSRHFDQFSAHIKNLYPMFTHGWEDAFSRLYSRLDSLANLYMIGRPALFLHCNIDHCITMAHALEQHLASNADKSEWNKTVGTFYRFQVKD